MAPEIFAPEIFSDARDFRRRSRRTVKPGSAPHEKNIQEKIFGPKVQRLCETATDIDTKQIMDGEDYLADSLVLSRVACVRVRTRTYAYVHIRTHAYVCVRIRIRHCDSMCTYGTQTYAYARVRTFV